MRNKGQKTRCIPAEFWQNNRNFAPVSTGTQTGIFAGVSGKAQDPKKGIGARIGLILAWGNSTLFQGMKFPKMQG
jgi:hypothetical protein